MWAGGSSDVIALETYRSASSAGGGKKTLDGVVYNTVQKNFFGKVLFLPKECRQIEQNEEVKSSKNLGRSSILLRPRFFLAATRGMTLIGTSPMQSHRTFPPAHTVRVLSTHSGYFLTKTQKETKVSKIPLMGVLPNLDLYQNSLVQPPKDASHQPPCTAQQQV